MGSIKILEYIIKREETNIKECQELLNQKLDAEDIQYLAEEIGNSHEMLELAKCAIKNLSKGE